MAETQARRLILHGRVQGVFFRDATRREALSEGLVGWVANRDDGTVEAWVEGEPDAVERMFAWCRAGAPGSVDRVDVDPVEPRGFTGFEIR